MSGAPLVTNTSEARASILSAIENALRDEPNAQLPPPCAIFPDAQTESPAELAARFRTELSMLHGEAVLVESAAQLPAALAQLLDERQLKTCAVANSDRVNAALARLAGDRFFQAAGAAVERIEAADCGIIEAQALLADTGSVIALFKNKGERLLPYLPPTCIVIADAAQLRPHMDEEALRSIYAAAREGSKGEAVIITGPSRSADIEKVLVLGAHGPHSVIVMISGVPPGDATTGS